MCISISKESAACIFSVEKGWKQQVILSLWYLHATIHCITLQKEHLPYIIVSEWGVSHTLVAMPTIVTRLYVCVRCILFHPVCRVSHCYQVVYSLHMTCWCQRSSWALEMCSLIYTLKPKKNSTIFHVYVCMYVFIQSIKSLVMTFDTSTYNSLYHYYNYCFTLY